MVGNRWTQYQEDSARLPEGFTRVEYDTDTQRYTFKDRDGVLYRGEQGSEYGIMTPIKDEILAFEQARPGAFASSQPGSGHPHSHEDDPETFQEILPPQLITTAEDFHSHSMLGNHHGHVKEHFVSAIKHCLCCGKHEKIHSHRGFEALIEDGEREGLLRRSSSDSSNLGLSDSDSISDLDSQLDDDTSAKSSNLLHHQA